VSQIDPNPHQARQHFDAERLRELAESIRAHGVIQPIVVKHINDRYMLIAGERRWRAATLAGLETIPAIVRNVPDRQVLELTLIENIQREDLNPIETAEAFARLTSEAGLTHEQISQRTGKDRATVTNFLRLLKLPEEVRRRVATGELSLGHARALLTLPTEAQQKTTAERTIAQGLSVRQLETIIQMGTGRPKKSVTVNGILKAALQDPNVQAAVQEMERALGTRVRLIGDDLHGRIIIEYHSSEDLDRIWDLIVGKR
jgi:ParB family chromosome partitioning protein